MKSDGSQITGKNQEKKLKSDGTQITGIVRKRN